MTKLPILSLNSKKTLIEEIDSGNKEESFINFEYESAEELISDNTLSLSDYTIEFLSKTKKVIEKIEKISHLNKVILDKEQNNNIRKNSKQKIKKKYYKKKYFKKKTK